VRLTAHKTRANSTIAQFNPFCARDAATLSFRFWFPARYVHDFRSTCVLITF